MYRSSDGGGDSGVIESDVLFDTSAWWEYLFETPMGARLRARFVEGDRTRIHTSAISLGEIGARLSEQGTEGQIGMVCGAIRRMSRIWDITADIAQDAGPARSRLRRDTKDASLADAIVLITAQRAGALIVSSDRAFRGVPGTIADA